MTLKRSSVVGVLAALAARAISVLGNIALFAVIGNAGGAEAAGLFAFTFGVVQGASMISRRGADSALVKYVGQDHWDRKILGYAWFAVRRTLPLMVTFTLGLYFGRDYFMSVFSRPGLGQMLVPMIVSIPAFTLVYLCSGFLKGVRAPAMATLVENGAISVLTSIAILVWSYSGRGFDASVMGWGFCASTWLSLVAGLVLVLRHCLGLAGKEVPDSDFFRAGRKEFYRASSVFFVMGFSAFAQSVLYMLAVGIILTSSELGIFKVAERAALGVTFLAIVGDSILPPRFAMHHFNDNKVELKRLAVIGAAFSFIPMIPVAIGLLLYSDTVMALFGLHGNIASNVLRIVVIAQLFNVMTGPVGPLLNMCGKEMVMCRISVLSNVVAFVMFVILSQAFREVGAALSLAAAIIMQNSLATYFVRRDLGINILSGWKAEVAHFFNSFRHKGNEG